MICSAFCYIKKNDYCQNKLPKKSFLSSEKFSSFSALKLMSVGVQIQAGERTKMKFITVDYLACKS